MKIKAKAHSFKKGILTVYLDDQPWKEIAVSVFGKRPLLPNADSEEEFEEKFCQYEQKQALLYALRRLSQQSYFSMELEKKLLEKGISFECAHAAIAKCQEEGYLNDTEWLESMVRGQIRRNKGPFAISVKLQSKGVSRETAERIVEKFCTEEIQIEQVSALLAKKETHDFEAKQKTIASIARRGFSFEIIEKALIN